MNIERILSELLRFIGGGGVALLGLWLTKRKQNSDDEFNIISDLQEENKRKDERLDKQDEKIQFLIDQMDEMRVEMFKIQSDKHKTEVKNVELESANGILTRENSELSIQLELSEKENVDLRIQLDTEIKRVRDELNDRIDRLIKENEDLRRQILNFKTN